MVKSARARRTQRDGAAAPVLPEDLVLWEIFYRLPAKEILRCRAACRSWHRLTRDADKALATVDAFDLSHSPAVRRPILGFSSYDQFNKYYIHASCDGLLLLSRTYRLYYICNPATRQWCPLPDVSNVTALYHHRPSGEYRVLYLPGTVSYYVLTVGSSLKGQRCVGIPVPSPSGVLDQGNPSVLLHDCLHWYSASTQCKVLVFDTVDESFRCMQSPPIAGYGAHLRQMDGTLCIHHLDRDTMIVQVWALQDYEMELWSLKCKIQLRVWELMKNVSDKFFGSWEVVSDSGDMLVCNHFHQLLFHYDSKGKLVDKFEEDFVTPSVLRLSFKESLVRHEFFERKVRKRVKLPGFFRGM
ncbi:unnamed protein product [Alopecurus aequalis]